MSRTLQRFMPYTIVHEALYRLSGKDSTENGPLSDLGGPCDPLEYREVLLEGYRAGFAGSVPTLIGEYTLQQHSSQTEVGPYTQSIRCDLSAHLHVPCVASTRYLASIHQLAEGRTGCQSCSQLTWRIRGTVFSISRAC